MEHKSNLRPLRSVFFTENCRVSRNLTGRDTPRISVVDSDKRYRARGAEGVRVEISDELQHTTICIPWHMVRDWEWAEEAPAEPAPELAKTKAVPKIPVALA